MQRSFYVSGFLYHSPSHQILLQLLRDEDDLNFTLFQGKSSNRRIEPHILFQHCVEKSLGITIPLSSIHPVYDYIHKKFGEQYIFYAEMAESTSATRSFGDNIEWLLLSKLNKYVMSDQTRHDIIVGERVIRAIVESALPPSPYKLH